MEMLKTVGRLSRSMRDLVQNMKHAYLILVHNNFYVLHTLLKMIDDKRNDIYIHVDSKCKSFDYNKCKSVVENSEIHFVKNYNVSWGGYSLIKAELSLMLESYQRGGYGYYHLISGTDLPIKSQDYIHNFFDENFGYEFITCATHVFTEKCNIISRFNTYHHTRNLFFLFLNAIKYKRYKYDFDVSFGSEWVSITESFVKCILEHKGWINKHFNYSHTCDEVYKQCIALNTDFKDKIYCFPSNSLYISFNMRYIDWSSGGAHPKILTMSDIDKILKSNCIFARKFDNLVDREVIDYIYDRVTSGDD